ncbi:MAG: hypothetical protein ABFD94_18985 [Armatimonadia bacterium]
MRKSLTIGAVLLAGLLPIILCGCSGSGAPAGDVEGASLQTLAADHLSAVITVAAWTKVFYMPFSDPGLHQEDDPVTGLIHIYGTSPVDHAVFDYYVNPSDSSSHGTIKWPDGDEFRQTCTLVYSDDYTSTHEQIANVYPNGAQLQYTVDTQFGPPTVSEWAGTATLPRGRHLTLRMRKQSGVDHLALVFDDGSGLQMTVPVMLLPAGWTIAYADRARGTYRNASGQSLSFGLTGTTRWETMETTAADGTTGSFNLQQRMDGTGELRSGGTLAAALQWDAEGLGLLDITGASQIEVTPSAAARDFRIDQWTDHAVGLGPMPVY